VLILTQRLQTHNIKNTAPHIALVQLRDGRRTLSSGLLGRKGWHGREERLRALQSVTRVGYRGGMRVGLIRAGLGSRGEHDRGEYE
jgi:hypothetical protein